MEEQSKEAVTGSGAALTEDNATEKSTENAIDYDGVLELALEVGAGLLSSGGSVSRVETAVDRICTSYGAHDVSVAAFPSMIQASLRSPDGRGHTFVKRVYSVSNNLKLLEAFNQLSRDICKNKYPVKEAQKMCFDVIHSKHRLKWVTILGSGLVAATYSVFFGGTVADCLPALLVALAMAGLSELLSTRSLNVYATTFLLSLFGGMLSISLCKLLVIIGLPVHSDLVMIGTIMILIPGLMSTNAVRDMFTGDLMSGTFTLLNALILTVVIAAGYGVSVFILNPIATPLDFVTRTPEEWQYYFYILLFGTLGAGAVCLFFNLRLKRIPWALLASLGALGVYVGLNAALPADMGNTATFFSNFLATLFAAIISEILARVIKTPATVFLIPSIIAFVPGSSLYKMMQAIVNGDLASAGSNGATCLMSLLGIAVGICAAAVLFRLISPVKLKYYKKNKMSMMRKAKMYGVEEVVADKPADEISDAKNQTSESSEDKKGE